MPAYLLPESLRTQLDDLAVTVRRLRVVRGISWWVLLLLALASSAIALDATCEFSSRARGYLFWVWIAVAVTAGCWFVGRRILEAPSLNLLAQLIEAKFPDLAERLQTLVQLSQETDPGNGSRTMMALLARETERQTETLDFQQAVATTPSYRLAGFVAAAGILSCVLMVFVSESTDRVRRLVVPWHSPPSSQPFEIVVSSGDPIVKRERSITVSGYLRKSQPQAALPDSADVHFRGIGSTDETTLPMVGDDKSAFTFTLPIVSTDLEYCISSGSVRSAWHTIAAVDSVEIETGEVTITAPHYASEHRPKQLVPKMTEMDVLAHSRLEWRLKLNRPAQAVQLEWRPTGASASAPTERLVVQLDESKTLATAKMTLEANGTLKWILFGEKDVRTELIQVLRAMADEPPRFEHVAGFPNRTRDIRPGEELKFALVVTDDLAVNAIELEYGPADAPDDSVFQTSPISLVGVGTKRCEGTATFHLPTTATDGQMFRVRLRIRDNRVFPELNWKPQSATYPGQGWATLRVSSLARPPAEQDVVARRDQFTLKLGIIEGWMAKATLDLKTHRLDYLGQQTLEQDQSVRLNENLELVRQSQKSLDELAREVGGIAELKQLGLLARELVGGDVTTAEAQLKMVLTETSVATRDLAARNAVTALEDVLVKLGQLRVAGETAMDDWLELTRLKQIGTAQSQLAESTKTTKDPVPLLAAQRELRDELQKLMQRNPTLREGAADAEEHRRQAVGNELRKLARRYLDLDGAIRQADAEANRDRFEELAQVQKRLAESMKSLAEKTDLAARLAQVAPLEFKPANTAREWLEKKKSIEAMTEQEKTASELERLADAFEKSAAERSDSKKVAQQLARWQDDLHRRLADGLKQTPRGDTPANRELWLAEQRAIHGVVLSISLPPSPAFDKLFQLTQETVAYAAEQLKRNPAEAGESLRKATDVLNSLVEKLPGQPQRWKAAAAELVKIRRDQDAISREIDETLRKTADLDEAIKPVKLAPITEKQQELTKRIREIDSPGLKHRRTAAVEASRTAGLDLQKGLPKDMALSQRDSSRQLEWWNQAFLGQTPADDQTRELARLQTELTDELTKLVKPSVADLQRVQRKQKLILRQLAQLQAPDFQMELLEIREAMQASDEALQQRESDLEPTIKKCRVAQTVVQRLAQQLNKQVTILVTAVPEVPVQLPNTKVATQLRELARDQRALRDQVARIAEAALKPPQQAKSDPLKAVAEKQLALAQSVELVDEVAAGAANAVGRALDVGDVLSAGIEAKLVLEKLAQVVRNAFEPALANRAAELHAEQSELIREVAKLEHEVGYRLARQQALQKELAQNCLDLAKRIDPLDSTHSVTEVLTQAAASMERAERFVGKNKLVEGAKARQDANEALAKSQGIVDGSKVPLRSGSEAEAARAAATAAQHAVGLMQKVETELSEPKGTPTVTMNEAAEWITFAVEKLRIANIKRR